MDLGWEGRLIICDFLVNGQQKKFVRTRVSTIGHLSKKSKRCEGMKINL